VHATLTSAGIAGRISDNILSEMWAKFSGFCCNAAVSTLTQALAGEIAAAPAGAGFVKATFDECARVTIAEGYPPPSAIRDLCVLCIPSPGSATGRRSTPISKRLAAGASPLEKALFAGTASRFYRIGI
jgi:2-dehydropantoate 2-reductase